MIASEAPAPRKAIRSWAEGVRGSSSVVASHCRMTVSESSAASKSITPSMMTSPVRSAAWAKGATNRTARRRNSTARAR